MPARLVLIIRWLALLVLLVAIALIVIRWKFPLKKTESRRTESTWSIIKALWIRWRQRARKAREHALDMAALHGKRIVLVGPEDKYIRAVRWKLESINCKVDRVRTGTQALSTIRNNKPDAVIADALLPDMSAADFCESIGENSMPIALIGVTDQHHLQVVKSRNLVLCTNFTEPDELVSRIGRLLRETGAADNQCGSGNQSIS
jgi:CheY-like chemotaxis protein